MTKPVVAIVGRPNVGKSTLFNRLVGQPSAIVTEEAGTTRDRVIAEAEWDGHAFILVDTGGLEVGAKSELRRQVRGQTDLAIGESDVVILMVDASEGLTAGDRDAADAVRVAAKPVVLVASKADNQRREAGAVEFYELGLGDPIPVSAYHNRGVEDLMTRVIALCPTMPETPEPEADLSLAIVGRTNVGKSMLLNTIVGQPRAIVSEIAGTTRDALDTLMRTEDGRVIRLIDTAGIRRRGQVEPGIEQYSVLRAIRAIDRADVAVVVLEATDLATAQDAHIAGYVLGAYKGIVLVVNKWDLAEQMGMDEAQASARVVERFKFARYAPIRFVSALRGTGIRELLDTVHAVYGEWTKGVPRYELRRVIMEAVAAHPPATAGRRALKLYGVTQEESGPPTFTFYVNHTDMVHFSYQRYLENRLREAYGFEGSRLKMRFKGRGGS